MSEEKNTAAVQAKTKRKEGAKNAPLDGKTVMYVGPTIRGVAAAGSLFKNGLPELLKREMEKQPAIRDLIVPVDRLAEANKELAMPDSALAAVYREIEKG